MEKEDDGITNIVIVIIVCMLHSIGNLINAHGYLKEHDDESNEAIR
jgi:hypothetical protein